MRRSPDSNGSAVNVESKIRRLILDKSDTDFMLLHSCCSVTSKKFTPMSRFSARRGLNFTNKLARKSVVGYANSAVIRMAMSASDAVDGYSCLLYTSRCV